MNLKNIKQSFTNKSMNAYYLHHFFARLASASGAHFTISYLFLFGGVTVQNLIIGTFLYSLSALIFLYPVAFFVNKFGIRRTHFLHLIPKSLDKIILLIMLFKLQQGESILMLFYLKMFMHGSTVMFKRIPLNSYIAYYGENETRGKQMALINSLSSLTAILSPLLIGSLIDHGYIIYVVMFSAFLSLTSSFFIGFKKDSVVSIKFDLPKINKLFPSNIKKAIFIPNLFYLFQHDLFGIWVITLFGGSFTKTGLFIGFKLLLDLVFSYLTGVFFDKNKIIPFYKTAIYFTALFWFICPFISTQWFESILPSGISPIMFFVILQSTVGIASLVWDEPYNAWYHNASKKSKEILGFSVYKEILIQSGVIFGCGLAYVLTNYTYNWHWFIMLGVIATLSRLYMIPKKI